jgi:hypothetical protein
LNLLDFAVSPVQIKRREVYSYGAEELCHRGREVLRREIELLVEMFFLVLSPF